MILLIVKMPVISIIITGDYNAKFQDIYSNYRLIAVKALLDDFDLIFVMTGYFC